MVAAAGDPDRTIRVFATEFLFDLGDGRSVSLALDQIANADENGRFNLLFVVKGAIQELGESDRAEAEQRLLQIDLENAPKTKSLVDQVISLGDPETEPKFWVIVGSFKSEETAEIFSDLINKEDPALQAFVGNPGPDSPVFPVIVGDFVEKETAEQIMQKALSTKTIADAFLGDYPDYK